MELWLVWAIAGFVLLIVEMLTGTFYLLVIGMGAFAAAGAAALGLNPLLQAILGSLVSLAGVYGVHHWRFSNRPGDPGGSNFLDRGQPVVLEEWAQENGPIARVKYRGTLWDARLATPDAHPSPGSTLYIVDHEGNTLIVDTAPAS
jgi:membrane protein implicated in regulation of membrane protease activity